MARLRSTSSSRSAYYGLNFLFNKVESIHCYLIFKLERLNINFVHMIFEEHVLSKHY